MIENQQNVNFMITILDVAYVYRLVCSDKYMAVPDETQFDHVHGLHLIKGGAYTQFIGLPKWE